MNIINININLYFKDTYILYCIFLKLEYKRNAENIENYIFNMVKDTYL